jgi:IS4 transposase
MNKVFSLLFEKGKYQIRTYSTAIKSNRLSQSAYSMLLGRIFKLATIKTKYPLKLRIVQVWDEDQEIYLELLTNNFTWTASTMSELYKRRWSIESFFKEIKTHLKIDSFIVNDIFYFNAQNLKPKKFITIIIGMIKN